MRVLHAEETIQSYISKYDMANFLNENLLDNLRLFHFPAFTNVYIADDEQEIFYFLVAGQVQCSHYHLNGTLAVIAISDPFTAIGDVEILNDERVQSNVTTTQETTLLGISREAIHLYGANDPRFLRFIVDQLRNKLYETNQMQVNQVLPVVKRLAIYILTEATRYNSAKIELPDKESLASLMGATPRHLNRVLKELKEANIINANYPHIEILDWKALQNFTN